MAVPDSSARPPRPWLAELAAVTALWALVSLPHLGGASLWDIDEGNNTEASREMRAADNWVVPTFNFDLRVDKPALINWLQILAGLAFGEGEFAARLPSALAALVTMLATWIIGRAWLGGAGGLLAACALGTSPMFIAAARFANPDSMLTALVTATIASHALGGRHGTWMLPAAVFSGMAMLAKGPIGLALPGAIIVAHLAWEGRLKSLANRWVGAAIALWLAVAAPWYLWVGAETKYAWLRGFFLEHNVGRFTSTMEGHGGGPWYYIPVLLAGMFPWTFFLVPAAGLARRGATSARPDLTRLVACWFVIPVAVFSLSSTKLPNYVLPCYPAAALLLAGGLLTWARGESRVDGRWMATGFAGMAVAGMAVGFAFLVAGGMAGSLGRFRPFPGIERWAWVGLAPVAGALVAFWIMGRSRKGALAAIAFGAALFSVSLGAWNGRTFNRYKAPEALARALPAHHLRHEMRLAAHDWFQPSLVFYARRRVQRLGKDSEAVLFLSQPLPACLAVSSAAWERLKGSLPETRELARRYDMYRRTEVVLVANRAAGRLDQPPANAEAGTLTTSSAPESPAGVSKSLAAR
ncbi:MAG: glycosyltransferase family 39 protein [Planctomycetes bacterium]|nr:glycosyltransferase family 39 protein [Planctomycetota bacterium]